MPKHRYLLCNECFTGFPASSVTTSSYSLISMDSPSTISKVMPSFSMDTPMRRSRKFRRNAYFSQSFGMAGERKSVFLQAHAGKTVDDRHPGAAHVGHVQAVLRVAVRVVQVQACCLDEILIRLVHIPDLRGHDAEDAGGQRRIMRRDAFIVVIRTLNRFQALLVFQQEVGEHRIRLFAHLVTVNGERMVVQRRIFVLRRVLEIPYRFAEERIVLRVNAECFIIREQMASAAFAQAEISTVVTPSRSHRDLKP